MQHPWRRIPPVFLSRHVVETGCDLDEGFKQFPSLARRMGLGAGDCLAAPSDVNMLGMGQDIWRGLAHLAGSVELLKKLTLTFNNPSGVGCQLRFDPPGRSLNLGKQPRFSSSIVVH